MIIGSSLPSGPRRSTPTSGVIIEVLYLCAVALAASVGAVAVRRGAAPPASDAAPDPSTASDVAPRRTKKARR